MRMRKAGAAVVAAGLALSSLTGCACTTTRSWDGETRTTCEFDESEDGLGWVGFFLNVLFDDDCE
jgi:hypothetical protein